MASSTHANAIAEPVVRPRRHTERRARGRRRHAHARGGILWIALSGILLAGVVFISVAVLRLNLALDRANSQRGNLTSQIATLQGQLATTLASWKIQQRAEEQGLRPATSIGYVDLSR